MASLKDLRNRIASVKATQKITRAMQMVAAAKLRKAQQAVEAARPYAGRMEAVIANLTAQVGGDGASPLLVGTGSDQRHLLLVCTAERGLAGAFNSSIARKARMHAQSLISEGKDVKFLYVGRKGYDMLRRSYDERTEELIDLKSVKNIGFENAADISANVLGRFERGEFDVCTLFYSEFKSVISQIPTAQQIIPVQVSAEAELTDLGGALYDYEPSEEAILIDLLPRNVTVQVFQALLENAASEQGARMSAMDNATRNAGDLIDKLTLTYNRARQAQITTELIEIISGAEAL